MAEEATQHIIPSTSPVRAFEEHENSVLAIAVFSDGRRMVTGSRDRTLRLWDLNSGDVLRKMEGHRSRISAVAVSRDGKLITSGDNKGEVIAWHGDSGESLAQAIKGFKAHYWAISSLDISPDGAVLATGSSDNTTKLWNTQTWQLQGKPIECSDEVNCVRYSPSGEHLAIATFGDIQIWTSDAKECIANFEGHAVVSRAYNVSIAWKPDGTRLLSAGSYRDCTIREWDSSTWKQVGKPWQGHSHFIDAITINSTGTLLASASYDNHVRLWRLSDQQTIAIFQHSDPVCCVTFSTDGEHILSGGNDKKIIQWAIPESALEQASNDVTEDFHYKILPIDTKVRHACISGDFSTAEELLKREIDTDSNNYLSYANRSFVMARKFDWEHALGDAVQSVSIQPSLLGYLSMGIALCGQMQVQDGMRALDLTFMFSNEDLKIVHFILLIKAIALFNANQHEEAMLRVQQLAVACPSANTIACHVVQAYLHLQLGNYALDNACYNEAADHFTTSINTNPSLFELDIHSIFEDFSVLFGWDLKNLWQNANQKRCIAFLRAGQLGAALKSYRYMMDMSDEASCLGWSAAFKQECSVLHSTTGNAALAASNYDEAIESYSAAIDLGSASDSTFANRSKARLEKMQWEDALVDALKVIDLNPSSELGYQLKYQALQGAQRYDEANEVFQIIHSKSGNTSDIQIRKNTRISHGSASTSSTVFQQSRRQYVIPPEAESAIRKAIHAQLDNAPLRLLHTSSGRLCDREAQIIAFKSSTEYKGFLSTKHGNLRKERIEEVVAMYFRRVMLSHRWEGKEPLLHDIQDKVVYKLKPVAGIVKLQSFCEIARDAGYHWAWIDTCCIDKHNNAELQESLNSMFVWYRYSALTIVYLSDVLPTSKSGAMARSAWNQRGWTLPEFLASEVVLFYQQDWTLYLNDRSPNHKKSTAIMQELEDMTGINLQALVAFRPGMRDAREKLQWASTRVTTLQEDIAYSSFGLFDVHLRVNYGEKKQNALGRLLQEIVAQSGDITVLDWVGKSSDFNSCLPADISSYEAPPFTLSSLSEDQIQKSVSSLRHTVSTELASGLYQKLDRLSAPRFAHRRLHLPCITFLVTEVKRRLGQDEATHFTYEVKSDGLHDLQITTEDRLIQFSRARPTRQTFLLVRPWDRCLLELPDFADDTERVEDWCSSEPPSHDSPDGSPRENGHVDAESHSRALRLVVRLGQPFGAFLLAQQRGGEYKRIASDYDIIAQVRDIASVDNMIDVRILEIL